MTSNMACAAPLAAAMEDNFCEACPTAVDPTTTLKNTWKKKELTLYIELNSF